MVIQREATGECLAGLEVKLTALPDNTTCDLHDKAYGSEVVVRPDTIVYLACSIATSLQNINDYIPKLKITDWSNAQQVLVRVETIVNAIESIALALEEKLRILFIEHSLPILNISPQVVKFRCYSGWLSYSVATLNNNVSGSLL